MGRSSEQVAAGRLRDILRGGLESEIMQTELDSAGVTEGASEILAAGREVRAAHAAAEDEIERGAARDLAPLTPRTSRTRTR